MLAMRGMSRAVQLGIVIIPWRPSADQPHHSQKRAKPIDSPLPNTNATSFGSSMMPVPSPLSPRQKASGVSLPSRVNCGSRLTSAPSHRYLPPPASDFLQPRVLSSCAKASDSCGGVRWAHRHCMRGWRERCSSWSSIARPAHSQQLAQPSPHTRHETRGQKARSVCCRSRMAP